MVTEAEPMEAAPFEWPEEYSELTGGGRLFRVDGDGWGEPPRGFDDTDENIEVLECMNELDGDCAPSSLAGSDCEYLSCCGTVHSDCPAEPEESCNRDSCELSCYYVDADCRCVEGLARYC